MAETEDIKTNPMEAHPSALPRDGITCESGSTEDNVIGRMRNNNLIGRETIHVSLLSQRNASDSPTNHRILR